MSTDKTDVEIIKCVLEGDTDLFAVIIDRYKTAVFKIVTGHIPEHSVEEVANDIFFKSFKSLKTFKNDAPFVHWLSVIAIRTCKDYWRLNYAKKESPMASFDEDLERSFENRASGITPEDALLLAERKSILLKAMEKLKPAERIVIDMIYTEERSVAEAASLTNMTESNIKVIAFRARRKLADILSAMPYIGGR